MFFAVFLSSAVFLATVQTAQQNDDCFGCSRCHTEHRTVNSTVYEFVIAICNFKAGVKRTRIPKNLPERLSTLLLSSHNIGKVETTSLKSYPFLQRLYLDKNRVKTIEDGSFSRQTYLTYLDLKENELSNITTETFRGLISLQTLRLDHNKLQSIPQATFATTPRLRKLDLRVNKITVLEKGAFDRLENLEILSLSFNNLRAINSGAFGNLMSLTQLELASNKIKSIDEDAFSCLPLIKSMLLEENQLKTIPTKSIQHLRFLDVLNISKNPLSLIASDAFIGLKSLTTVHLNDCNISAIIRNAFYGLPELKAIYLQNNPLNCNCHLSWLSKWLSENARVTSDYPVCQLPRNLVGKILTSLDLQSFVCTCEDCCCSPPHANCSYSENRTRLSCTDICQSVNYSVGRCSKFRQRCYCEKNASIWNTTSKLSNCSFNMTSDKCSKDGEIRKYGAHLKCLCKKGFTGDGFNCTDIDECGKTGSALCAVNAECINTPGSYHCKCREGFKKQEYGFFCNDIDECKESQSCDRHAKCHNNKGSFVCLCLPGYAGNGKTCLPVPHKPSQITITEVDSSKFSVTWKLTNLTMISHLTIEYKKIGILDFKWEIVKLNPHITRANLTDLQADSSYLLRIGVFSIFNTSIYSDETMFSTSTLQPDLETNRSGNSGVIVAAVTVSVALLLLVAFVLYFVMKQRKKRKKKPTYPRYVPGLEDPIEMQTQSLSGGIESRGNRDLLELEGNLRSLIVDYQDEWEVSRDLLSIGQKIGEGQFGLVLKGTLMTEDGAMEVAVKTVKENADRFDIKDLLQELKMMKEIGQHPHVVSLVGACTTSGPLYIITEYISGGNLLNYLRYSRPADDTYVNISSTLSSRDLLKIALDCARGMNHIADRKFVHRDLAARNILLTQECEAKVADFGLARDIYGDGQYVKSGGGRLPIKWMAPESIEDQIYTTMSDIWSFGILLWEIVTIGGVPYPCVPVNLLLTKLLCGYRMSKPVHCSNELYDLMTSCWEQDPEARPTFSQICLILSEMLSQSARSYVNITVSNRRKRSDGKVAYEMHKQTF